ncbi:MAG: hypothetical protein E6Q34_05575 [Burkholderiaceae bacterium]|nr:MAG: hypothetical protein E6Q34_05575 [Burkholderiaceae bacterium]
MAYSLHIESTKGPIPLEAWKKAVDTIEGARYVEAERLVTNPFSGERILVKGNEGDIEISTSSFSVGISFRRGRVTFSNRKEFDDPLNSIRLALAKLAAILDAKVIGDEGEIYEW